jgi:glycosyltransferase involved in cell wall biosynthesis
VKELITIGITCWREGELLRQCWESVFNQTCSDWEAVLVLDGGADPETQRVFEEVSDTRVRKVRNDNNLGPYRTRNRALAETRTTLHYYLDGDDELIPEAIERVLAWGKKVPNADIYYTDLLTSRSKSSNVYLPSPTNISAEIFVQGRPLYGASIIRTELWERIGGYREEFGWTLGDYDFYMTAWEAGAVFCHIPEPLYVYKRRPGSVSDTYAHEYHEIYRLLIERHPRIFADPVAKNRFMALGYISAATALFGKMRMQEAEAMARQACDLGREKEGLALLKKIERDKLWPKPLLWIRRKASVFAERKLTELRLRKAASNE